MTVQKSINFHIFTPYDATVWVRHSVLTQKPASFPGDCLNTLWTGDADLCFYITTVQDG